MAGAELSNIIAEHNQCSLGLKRPQRESSPRVSFTSEGTHAPRLREGSIKPSQLVFLSVS